MPTFFKVSELSQQTGIHTETIRYYEKIGLLPPPKRSNNGYRCYTTDSVQQLLFIKTCRSLGFSLEEIKTLYHWQQNPVSHCQQVDDLVAQHLEQVILPALVAGKIVLSDRFTDASFAYQCSGRGLSQDKLQLLNQTFVAKMPNITFWLDAPIETGLSRARERGALDRFEQEKVSFFEKVRAGFVEIQQREPQRMKRLDATQNPEQVLADALAYLASFEIVNARVTG